MWMPQTSASSTSAAARKTADGPPSETCQLGTTEIEGCDPAMAGLGTLSETASTDCSFRSCSPSPGTLTRHISFSRRSLLPSSCCFTICAGRHISTLLLSLLLSCTSTRDPGRKGSRRVSSVCLMIRMKLSREMHFVCQGQGPETAHYGCGAVTVVVQNERPKFCSSHRLALYV